VLEEKKIYLSYNGVPSQVKLRGFKYTMEHANDTLMYLSKGKRTDRVRHDKYVGQNGKSINRAKREVTSRGWWVHQQGKVGSP
jgi:hypothetical protein